MSKTLTPNDVVWGWDGDDPLPPNVRIPKRKDRLEFKQIYTASELIEVMSVYAGLRNSMRDDKRSDLGMSVLRNFFDEDPYYFVSQVLLHVAPLILDAYELMDRRLHAHVSIELFAQEIAYVTDWNDYWNAGTLRTLDHYVERVNDVLIPRLIITGDLGIDAI
jgi:hypothetical protein